MLLVRYLREARWLLLILNLVEMMNESNDFIKVLIVDDEERLLRILRLGLKPKGIEVLTSSTAEEALKLILNKTIDIVVTDVRLGGGMSGVDLVYELERLGVDLPVIVMTAYGDVDTAVKSFRHGAFDYIQKPFTVDELEELIRKVPSSLSKNATSVITPLDEGVSQKEKELIVKALESSGHNKVKAAKLLKISERTLWYKLKKYHLQ